MKMYRKQFIEKTESFLPDNYFGSARYPKHNTAEIVRALKGNFTVPAPRR